MNWEHFFEQKIILIALVGMAAVAILIKFLVAMSFRRLIRAASDMGHSQNRLMKQLLLKFETCYQLKLGVDDVDTFMDKYILGYRILHIHLYTWENLGNQFFVLTLIGSITGGIAALYMDLGQVSFFSIILCGFILCGVILFFDGVLNLSMKKELLRIHIKDYLGNICRPRLEKEAFHPEELERYRNEYFDDSEKEAIVNSEVPPEKKQEDGLQIEFTTEEEKVISEVLKEYMA